MENERLICFRSILRRICFSDTYCIQLILSLVMGLVGTAFWWKIRLMNGNALESTLQLFWTGNNYQLGFFALSDWRAGSDGYCDAFLRGALAGTFASTSVAFHVVRFLGREYRGSYLQLSMMRGQSRGRLFLSYELGTAVTVLPILLLFIAGTWLSTAAVGACALQSATGTIAVILAQILMLLCLDACFAAIALNLNESSTILLLGATLGAPALSSYMMLLIHAPGFSSGIFLLTRLAYSNTMKLAKIPDALARSMLSAVLWAGIGLPAFCWKNIE